MKRSGKIVGFALAMLLLFPGSKVLADTKPAKIWASVQFSKPGVMVGEPLMVTITVYTSTWFTAPPEFSEIQVPEAMMVDYHQRTGSMRKTIGNKTYPAIEKKFVVYPFRVGENRLPALTIVTESPPEGDYKGKKRVIKSPERTFMVAPPPEGIAMDRWLTAYNVELYEQWDKPLDQLKQGDVRERRITIQAYGALAALIPPLELPGGDYGNVYSKPAELSNVQNQNNFTGVRTENWTYLMEAGGTFTIPGILLSWYNPGTGKLESTAIESRELSIAENPDLDFLLTMQDSLQAMLETGEEVVPEPFEWMGLNWWQLSIAVITGIILLFLMFRLIRNLVRSLKKREEEHTESEKRSFEILERTGREGSPEAVMGALLRWYDRFREGRFQPGFGTFIAFTGNEELQDLYNRLERILFTGEEKGNWDGRELVELIGRERLRAKKETGFVSNRRLHPLNPE